jgi:hypothetical protein
LPAVPEDILKAFSWRGQARGWVTNAIMQEAIGKTFVQEIIRRRQAKPGLAIAPAILFMGGHVSHVTNTIKMMLAAHNIHLRIFVPHCSHIQQPLDLVLFGKYKAILRSVCFSLFSFSFFLH